jgi:hypothetical protein
MLGASAVVVPWSAIVGLPSWEFRDAALKERDIGLGWR